MTGVRVHIIFGAILVMYDNVMSLARASISGTSKAFNAGGLPYCCRADCIYRKSRCHVLVLYETAIYRCDILQAPVRYVVEAGGIHGVDTPILDRQGFRSIKSACPAYTKSYIFPTPRAMCTRGIITALMLVRLDSEYPLNSRRQQLYVCMYVC